ncbi:recombinase family protein [Aestuariivivens sediminis]|uniref:recombinase family protein n=1 Tax=Aestuariivivens sediminis TaxID=2913557 RepID=UPI001F5787D3|nr:recombinase family protein [Aestuariivivens sediminis]
MKDTIIYCRVSTDDQADNGYGRNYQLEKLQMTCEAKKYDIAKEFLEDHSAKDFNRPEWKKLEEYIKANRKTIKRVIFTKWDRFSRNQPEALKVIEKFNSWGIELNAIEQPLDLSDPNSKILLAMYLVLPEVENDYISIRTKAGMYSASKEGAFLGTPPFGFKRMRIDKHATMEPDENVQLVKDIFYKVSQGAESVEGIRKEFIKKGYTRCKQSFYNMLRNQAYIGKVKVPKHNNQESYWANGLHNSIIEISIFNKVQNVLEGRNRNAKPPSKKKESLPLRGFLECEYCGGNLTGSVSKGNGGQYGYYHCRGNCKNRVSSIKADKMIGEILADINFNENVLKLYRDIIIDIQKGKRSNKAVKIKEIQSNIDGTRHLWESAEDKFNRDLINPEDFHRMSNRYEENLRTWKLELQDLKEAIELPVKMIEKAVNALRNIPQLYMDGDYEQKTGLIGLLFPEKMIFSKNGCRTKKRNIVIELLTRVNKASQELGTKKAITSDGLSNLAPPLGLEPRTL